MDAEEYSLDVKDKLLADNSYLNSTANLIRNFLRLALNRGETPLSTLETGQRSTSLAHMASISLATKQRLEWDSVNERFTNSEEANKLLLMNIVNPGNCKSILGQKKIG